MENAPSNNEASSGTSALDDGLAVFPVPAFLRSPAQVQADAMLATFTMHTPSGPTHCCVKHARQLESVMRMLGGHTNATKAPDGAVCESCENEAKAKTANDQAQGEAQGSSRLSPGATGSAARDSEKENDSEHC